MTSEQEKEKGRAVADGMRACGYSDKEIHDYAQEQISQVDAELAEMARRRLLLSRNLRSWQSVQDSLSDV